MDPTSSNAIYWLMAANMVVWIGLGAYAAFIAIKQNKLATQLKHLEILDHGKHNGE